MTIGIIDSDGKVGNASVMREARRYSNAPAQEVVLTASFQPVATLTILEMAALATELSDDYPNFREVMPGGPMPGVFGQIQIQFPAAFTPPRLAFSSEDLEHTVLFQNDRVSFGWTKQPGVTGPSSYPGFDFMQKSFCEVYERVTTWLGRFAGPIRPHVAEIAYTNRINLVEDGMQRSLSEILRFYTNPGQRPMVGFGTQWNEQVEADGISGSYASNFTFDLSPTGEPGVAFNLAGTALVGDTELLKVFDALHEQIEQIFENALEPGLLKPIK